METKIGKEQINISKLTFQEKMLSRRKGWNTMEFRLKGKFPEMYRTFCDGELSLCMERYGGIDAISLLDVEDLNGYPFPDQNCVPLLARYSSNSMGRSLYGSAVRFLGITEKKRYYYFHPNDPVVMPWFVSGGDAEGNFEMLLDHSTVLFRCESSRMKLLDIFINPEHFFNGSFQSYKNQRLTRVEREHYSRAGVAPDDFPALSNGLAQCCWEKDPEWDGQCLVFHNTVTFPYGIRHIYMAIASDAVMEYNGNGPLIELKGAFPPSGRIYSALSVAGDRESAIRNVLNGVKTFESSKERKIKHLEKLEENAPGISCREVPLIQNFMEAEISYQNAMLICDGRITRASSHNYGAFPFWDSIWPIRDFIWQNQHDIAEKTLRYLISYPHLDGRPWTTLQLIAQFNEYLAYHPDSELIPFAMPYFRKFLKVAGRLCHASSGLIATLDNAANDKPEEAGIHGFYCASCINGLWYNALRILLNLGMEYQDDEMCSLARELTGKVEKHFVKTFFLSDPGYLRLAVKDDLTPFPNDVFQNSSTIGLDYLYGRYLMRDILEDLAAYQATALYHPMGHCATAPDSRVGCEMWRNVHMNQHLGHEAKLARLAGYTQEAYRSLEAYLDVYDQYKIAVETFNLCGCAYNESQNANWQTFSASAAAEAIRTLSGFEVHRGGCVFTPADDYRNFTIRSFRFREMSFEISIAGKGPYAVMEINDVPLNSSLQIPIDFLAGGEIKLRIIRSENPPDGIQLRNAFDLPVLRLHAEKRRLTFVAGASGFFPISAWSPCPPEVFVNGNAVKAEYDPEKKIVWADAEIHAGNEISLQY